MLQYSWTVSRKQHAVLTVYLYCSIHPSFLSVIITAASCCVCCISNVKSRLHLMCVDVQVHSRGHAVTLQHALQLQKTRGSDDLCRLVPVLCHLLPAAVWTQQHRYTQLDLITNGIHRSTVFSFLVHARSTLAL